MIIFVIVEFSVLDSSYILFLNKASRPYSFLNKVQLKLSQLVTKKGPGDEHSPGEKRRGQARSLVSSFLNPTLAKKAG